MMRVEHVNIVVADMERSRAFYVGLLGMRQTLDTILEGSWIERVSGLHGVEARCVFCEPAAGGVRFELLEYRSPEGQHLPATELANTHGLRHVALEVADIDSWYARLCAAGIEFIAPPVDVPFFLPGNIQKRLCYLRDPDGVLLELAEYRAAE